MEVILYQNNDLYPMFNKSITEIRRLDYVPIKASQKGGIIRVEEYLGVPFVDYNYLGIVGAGSSGYTIFGWIDDVQNVNGNMVDLHYSVDSFRTYKETIRPESVQFISRSVKPTDKFDPLLSRKSGNSDVEGLLYTLISNDEEKHDEGFLVLQTKPIKNKTIVGENIPSNTPGSPSPYKFWITKFNTYQPIAQIDEFLKDLSDNGQTQNIITMYTIPFCPGYDNLENGVLEIQRNMEGIDTSITAKFKPILPDTNLKETFSYVKEQELTGEDFNFKYERTKHKFSLITPEGQVLSIPDSATYTKEGKLFYRYLRQVDVTNGVVTTSLVSYGDGGLGDGLTQQHVPWLLPYSVRGSTSGSIPILSDEKDNYIAGAKNDLMIGLLGDAATAGIGALAAPVTGGMSMMATSGAGGSAVSRVVNFSSGLAQASKSPASTPVFSSGNNSITYGNGFIQVIEYMPQDNHDIVHSNFGYPFEALGELTIPNSGYIQTSNCNLSFRRAIPKWAIEEINTLFDRGLLFI